MGKTVAVYNLNQKPRFSAFVSLLAMLQTRSKDIRFLAWFIDYTIKNWIFPCHIYKQLSVFLNFILKS